MLPLPPSDPSSTDKYLRDCELHGYKSNRTISPIMKILLINSKAQRVRYARQARFRTFWKRFSPSALWNMEKLFFKQYLLLERSNSYISRVFSCSFSKVLGFCDAQRCQLRRYEEIPDDRARVLEKKKKMKNSRA